MLLVTQLNVAPLESAKQSGSKEVRELLEEYLSQTVTSAAAPPPGQSGTAAAGAAPATGAGDTAP